MRLALHWRSLDRTSLGLEALLDIASAAGFVGVQANRVQIDEYAARRPNSRLVKLVAASGLCQTATWAGVELEAPEDEFRAACEGIERFRYRARALASFGVGQPAVLVRAPGAALDGGAEASAVQGRLRAVAGLLARSDLTLLLDPSDPAPGARQAVRPLSPEEQEPDIERLAGWVRGAGAANVGLVADLWRWPGLAGGGAGMAALRGLTLLGRMADVPEPLPAAPGAVPRLVPGRGALDLARGLRRFRAMGYDGYWEVEAPLQGDDPGPAALRCRRAGERVLEDAVRF